MASQTPPGISAEAYRSRGWRDESSAATDCRYAVAMASKMRARSPTRITAPPPSGAEGWAELDEETAAKLGDAVLTVGEKKYPASFELGGVAFVGTAEENGVVYTGEVNGENVELMAYVCTDEGGAWYYESNPATLLNAQGEAVAEIEIGTKASIEHGVAFWPSEIKFPGNIERIEAYLSENGVNYTEDQIVKGENGVWNVADVTTGATLAGTKNYLLIAQRAYENAQGK